MFQKIAGLLAIAASTSQANLSHLELLANAPAAQVQQQNNQEAVTALIRQITDSVQPEDLTIYYRTSDSRVNGKVYFAKGYNVELKSLVEFIYMRMSNGDNILRTLIYDTEFSRATPSPVSPGVLVALTIVEGGKNPIDGTPKGAELTFGYVRKNDSQTIDPDRTKDLGFPQYSNPQTRARVADTYAKAIRTPINEKLK